VRTLDVSRALLPKAGRRERALMEKRGDPSSIQLPSPVQAAENGGETWLKSHEHELDSENWEDGTERISNEHDLSIRMEGILHEIRAREQFSSEEDDGTLRAQVRDLLQSVKSGRVPVRDYDTKLAIFDVLVEAG